MSADHLLDSHSQDTGSNKGASFSVVRRVLHVDIGWQRSVDRKFPVQSLPTCCTSYACLLDDREMIVEWMQLSLGLRGYRMARALHLRLHNSSC